MRNKQPAKTSIGIDMNKKVITDWGTHFPNVCELIHGDALEFLSNYKYEGNELIYSDPPYLPSTRKRLKVYPCDYSVNDHEKYLAQIKQTPCMIMISGYDSELYNDSLQGWRKETFFSKTHTDTRLECVWMNFQKPAQLHDTSYLGENFRERQTIRDRQLRLQSRIQKMNPIERNAFLDWISKNYKNEIQEVA